MFIENFLTASTQVAILYVLVFVGFIADKAGIFTQKAAKLCTDLLFYVITTAKIVESFMLMEFTRETAKGFLAATLGGVIIHVTAIIISTFMFNKSGPNRAPVFKFGATYGNCGYMALPLASAVLGTQGVFYCSAVIMTFQIFSFTHGIFIMTKDENGKGKLGIKKILLNPGTIAVIIGLPLFLLKIHLPQILDEPVHYLASMNTPLAMLVFGTYLANTDAKLAIKEWRILIVALVKLILIPALCLVIFKLSGINGALLTALIISASAPTANNTVLFAAKYDRDISLAYQTVAVVSFISVITMPLFIAIASSI